MKCGRLHNSRRIHYFECINAFILSSTVIPHEVSASVQTIITMLNSITCYEGIEGEGQIRVLVLFSIFVYVDLVKCLCV